MKRHTKRRGFTLIELLIVICVLFALLSLGMAVVSRTSMLDPKVPIKITNIQQVLMKNEHECIVLVQDTEATEVKMATIYACSCKKIKIVADVESGSPMWLEGMTNADIDYSKSTPIIVKDVTLHVRTAQDIGRAMEK